MPETVTSQKTPAVTFDREDPCVDQHGVQKRQYRYAAPLFGKYDDQKAGPQPSWFNLLVAMDRAIDQVLEDVDRDPKKRLFRQHRSWLDRAAKWVGDVESLPDFQQALGILDWWWRRLKAGMLPMASGETNPHWRWACTNPIIGVARWLPPTGFDALSPRGEALWNELHAPKKEAEPPGPPLLSADETAKRLGVSRARVHALAAGKRLPSVDTPHGTRVLRHFRESDVEAFAKANPQVGKEKGKAESGA